MSNTTNPTAKAGPSRGLILGILGALLAVLVAVVLIVTLGGDGGGDAAPGGDGTVGTDNGAAGNGGGGVTSDTGADGTAAHNLAGDLARPQNTLADGGIAVGPGGAAGAAINPAVPTVQVFLDYLCSFCNLFEEMHLDTLTGYFNDGTANLVLYPVSGVGGETSVRISAAVFWVVDREPARFWDFHEGIYHYFFGSPTSDSNETIAQIARDAGVSEAVADGIADGTAATTFSPWVSASSQNFFTWEGLEHPTDGRRGTPTITINGERWFGNWTVDAAALGQDVAAAAGN